MAAYNGQSKRMKDAIIATLAAITYDTGGGPEPAFANVIDNMYVAFEGDPNVQVLPGGLDIGRETASQTDKKPSYIVRVRIPIEDNNKSQSAAMNQMYDLTDLIIDTLAEADHNSAFEDGREPDDGPLGTYMLDVTRGAWFVDDSNGGLELVCDVDVQNSYSKNLA